MNKIAKNFSSLIFAHIVYKILAFFTYLLLARYLGAANFGQLSFALSFVGLFTVTLDFGLSELLIRDVAGRISELSQKYISNILTAKLVLSIVSYGLIGLIGSMLSRTQEIKAAVLILAAGLALDSFTIFFRSIFRLFEKMEFEAFSLIAESILKFGIIFMALKYMGIKLLIVAWALLLVSFLTAILTSFLSYLRFVKLQLSFNYEFCKTLFKRSLPFAFLTFFGVVNFKITIVMVSHLVNDITTGWYSAAVRLVEPILIIPITAAIVLFSTASRLYKSSPNSLISLYKISLRILFWTALLLVLLLNIYSDKIIPFIFGKEYINSTVPLKILSLSIIPFFLKFFLERIILVVDRPRVIFLSYGLGILITVVFGLPLIQNIGYIGAGIALVLSEFFIVGYNFVWTERCLIKTPSITLTKESAI